MAGAKVNSVEDGERKIPVIANGVVEHTVQEAVDVIGMQYASIDRSHRIYLIKRGY